jgi:hypothetical protein
MALLEKTVNYNINKTLWRQKKKKIIKKHHNINVKFVK